MTRQIIHRAICSRRFRFATEREFQDGIAEAFTADGIEHEREVRLDAGDIVDFMVGGIAVEVKIGGSLAALTRQLARYARHERVGEILVISSKHVLARLPASLGAKPLHVIVPPGGLL